MRGRDTGSGHGVICAAARGADGCPDAGEVGDGSDPGPARLPPVGAVVMLTGSLTRGSLHEAMQAGAVGYLLKGGPPNELVNAVRAVAAGGTAWPSGDAAPHAGPSWR